LLGGAKEEAASCPGVGGDTLEVLDNRGDTPHENWLAGHSEARGGEWQKKWLQQPAAAAGGTTGSTAGVT